MAAMTFRRQLTGSDLRSCSQIRTTLHPASRNWRVLALSRFTLQVILGPQYSQFDFEAKPHFRHPCQ
jgi:hypothetical protein